MKIYTWDNSITEQQNLAFNGLIWQMFVRRLWFNRACWKTSEKFGVDRKWLKDYAKKNLAGKWRIVYACKFTHLDTHSNDISFSSERLRSDVSWDYINNNWDDSLLGNDSHRHYEFCKGEQKC